MADINNITFSGYLGSDPDIKIFESGAKKASFSVAVKKYGGATRGEYTIWYKCSAFGALADFLEKYAHSGARVFVVGEGDFYQNSDGKDTFCITANNVIIPKSI